MNSSKTISINTFLQPNILHIPIVGAVGANSMSWFSCNTRDCLMFCIILYSWVGIRQTLSVKKINCYGKFSLARCLLPCDFASHAFDFDLHIGSRFLKNTGFAIPEFGL